MSKMESKSTVAASVAALVAGTSFGFGGALNQVVSSWGFQIQHIVVFQYLAALAILGTLVLLRFRAKIPVKQVLQLGVVGALSVLSTITYYFAIDLLSVGQAVAIQFQYVWIAVAIQCVAERTRPGKWVVIATCAVIVGTLLGSGFMDELLSGSVSLNPAGVGFALICAVCYGAFIYLNGRIAIEYPPVTRTFCMVVAGFVVASVAFPSFYTGGCDVIALIPGGFLMGLMMSVIPCVGLAVASRSLSGGIVAILSSSELPMAVLAGFLLFGERVTPLIILGVILIIASIVLSQVEELTAMKNPVECEEL